MAASAIIGGAVLGGVVLSNEEKKKAKKSQLKGIDAGKSNLEDAKKGTYKTQYTLPDGKKVGYDEAVEYIKSEQKPAFSKDGTGIVDMFEPIEDKLAKLNPEEVIDEKGYDQYVQDAENRVIDARDGALEYTQQGLDNSIRDIEKGRDDALGSIQKGMDQMSGQYEGAIDRYEPYAKAGNKALSMYMDTFSGDGSSSILNSPIFKAKQQQMNKAIATQMAQTGRGGSMKSIESTFAPAQQNLMAQEYNDYFNRLNPIINYGYNASSNQANLQSQVGNNLMKGNNLMGTTSYNAGMQLGANQMSANNNMAGIYQMGGSQLAGLSQDQANMQYQYGTDQANLSIGEGAANANYHNAIAGSYDNLVNSGSQLAGSLMGGV